MTRALVGAFTVCLLLAGCGGSSAPTPPAGGAPAAAGGFSATLLRSASGAPSGVRVSWEAVPLATGYNLYRMATAIPDSERGSAVNRVASNIPNVTVPGTVSYDDMFPVTVGEEWHYRISSLDASGDESDLSPENALTITDFLVTQLLDVTGGVGDTVEIAGERFGIYDSTGDKVYFRGVRLESDGNILDALLEAPVTDWQADRITCTVPPGTTSGQVTVQSAGLQQLTPETFTNSDPYIESVSPLHGTTDDVVTITGRNFGAAQDGTHNVLIDGDALPPGRYIVYGDTWIQALPTTDAGAARFNQPLSVKVQVGSRTSNPGQFTIDNRPPVAAISASPPDGSTPQTVDFDASASADPDLGDSISFLWDFDGDGTFEFDSGPDATVSHTYDKSGDFTPGVFVHDVNFASDTATQDIHVSLSRMQLLDNGNFAPTSEFFQEDGVVSFNFIIQGGEPDYSIDWFLVDPAARSETKIATDTLIPYGVNSRQFTINTDLGSPVADSGEIPAGTWSVRAEAHDGGAGNDPDPIVVWPTFANGTPGTFSVYRYFALVVVDGQGDPTGSESTLVSGQLQKRGYKVNNKSSANLTLGDMSDKDVVIWPADGPHGKLPYEWLSTADLALARQYLGSPNGGSLLIAGPPAANGEIPFSQDMAFQDGFMSMDMIFQGGSPQSMTCASFTSGDPDGYSIQRVVIEGGLGGSDQFSTPAGATHIPQMTYMNAAGTPLTSCDCTIADSLQWKTYLCPFSFSAISSIAPDGATVDELLDNIVAGIADRSQ